MDLPLYIIPLCTDRRRFPSDQRTLALIHEFVGVRCVQLVLRVLIDCVCVYTAGVYKKERIYYRVSLWNVVINARNI